MEIIGVTDVEVVLYDDREETHIPLVSNGLTEGSMYSNDTGGILQIYLCIR